MKESLAEGSSGIVYRALNRHSALPAAIKVTRRDAKRDSVSSEEIKMLQFLGRHPYICNLLDYFCDSRDKSATLAMELLDGGNLAQLAEAGAEGLAPCAQTRRISAQVCEALRFVHSQGVAQRALY